MKLAAFDESCQSSISELLHSKAWSKLTGYKAVAVDLMEDLTVHLLQPQGRAVRVSTSARVT